MNDTKQMALLGQSTKTRARAFIYVPPEPKVIDSYAASIWKRLNSEEIPQKSKLQDERGLATFLKVVVRITSHYLNKESRYG